MNSLLLENNLGDVYIIADQVKGSAGTDLKIDIAFSLTTALKFLDKKEYDIILVDFNLPEASGAAILKPVISRAFLTPVIVLDDYYCENNRRASLLYGAADYIVKNSLDCVSLESVVKNSIDRLKIEKTLLNNIPVPVILCRPEDREVLWINKECENIAGISLRDARKKKADEIVRFFSAGDRAAFLQCIEAQEHAGRLVTFKRADDKSFNGIVSVMKNSSEGLPFVIMVINNADGALAGMYNISRTNQTEAGEGFTPDIIQKLNERISLLEKETADSSNLMNIIFHDLKTPFTALVGYSQFMAEELDEMSPKEIREFSAEINRTLKNVQRLVEEMLQWSIAHSGKTAFNPVVFDLNEVLLDAIELIKPSSKLNNITLLTGLQENLKVCADKNMIAAVVRNLLSNAVKYTMSNEDGVIKVSSEIRGDNVNVEISDSGIGIRNEDLPELFEIKSQLRKYGQVKDKGTGIGLVLCMEYIKKNNGTISAQSNGSTGSTFTFTLPFYN
ncbi:MAG: ATP-binding protein [Syntrophothermus sp.]